MKRFSVILLTMLITLSANGQGSFAPVGAEWHYQDHYSRYDVWNSGSAWLDHVRVEKDTAIDGVACRKLVVSRWSKSAGNNNAYLTSTKNLFVYDNVDTVFMFNQYSNSFRPLYVFNASVGDTVCVSTFAEPDAWHYPDSNFYYVVDSINVELYDMIPLKTFYTTSLLPIEKGKGSFNFGDIIIREMPNAQPQRYHSGKYTEKLGGSSSFSSLLPNFRLAWAVDWTYPNDAPVGNIMCYSDSNVNIRNSLLPCDSFAAPLVGIVNRY
mgnify:FL=1